MKKIIKLQLSILLPVIETISLTIEKETQKEEEWLDLPPNKQMSPGKLPLLREMESLVKQINNAALKLQEMVENK